MANYACLPLCRGSVKTCQGAPFLVRTLLKFSWLSILCATISFLLTISLMEDMSTINLFSVVTFEEWILSNSDLLSVMTWISIIDKSNIYNTIFERKNAASHASNIAKVSAVTVDLATRRIFVELHATGEIKLLLSFNKTTYAP